MTTTEARKFIRAREGHDSSPAEVRKSLGERGTPRAPRSLQKFDAGTTDHPGLRRLLTALSDAGFKVKGTGDSWRSGCPICGSDRTLTIGVSEITGDLLIHCHHESCRARGKVGVGEILRVLGLKWADLMARV
jgi:hypothetical protein